MYFCRAVYKKKNKTNPPPPSASKQGSGGSIASYRDMGQGMGQGSMSKMSPNLQRQKTKEKFRNQYDSGTILAKVHEVDTILQEAAMQQLIHRVLFR